MKKLFAIAATAFFVLAACNALNQNGDDEVNAIDNNKTVIEKNEPKNTINRGLNGVDHNNNGTNPYALDENTKIKYDDKVIMLNSLANEIDAKLESENTGVNFKVIVEAEDDNTQ